jgi:hypothetical protein
MCELHILAPSPKKSGKKDMGKIFKQQYIEHAENTLM